MIKLDQNYLRPVVHWETTVLLLWAVGQNWEAEQVEYNAVVLVATAD